MKAACLLALVLAATLAVGSRAQLPTDCTGLSDGTVCEGDGNDCTWEECQSGACTILSPVSYAPDGSPCPATDLCHDGTCDGNGACVSTPVACPGGDECNDATCNTADGSCSVTPKAENSTCNGTDACSAGLCSAAGVCEQVPKVCPSGDSCNTASCDPVNGCALTPKAVNTSCPAADSCSIGLCALDGTCTQTPKVCPGGDSCNAAVCDPVNGCTLTPKAENTSCPAADSCSIGLCALDGTCTQTPKVCPGGDSCNTAVCDPVNGCTLTPKAENTSCPATDACSIGMCALNGTCIQTQKVCPGGDSCNSASCHPVNGCTLTPKAENTSCPATDSCSIGLCALNGTCIQTPKVCPGGDACNTATCDPQSGGCSVLPKPVNTSCPGTNACFNGLCSTAGQCVQAPKVCPSDDCNIGVCNVTSGCQLRPKPGGTACVRAGGSPCSMDKCLGGICTPGNSPAISMKCREPRDLSWLPAGANCQARLPVSLLFKSISYGRGASIASPLISASPASPYPLGTTNVTVSASARVTWGGRSDTCAASCGTAVTVVDTEPVNPMLISCGFPDPLASSTVIVPGVNYTFTAQYTGTKLNGCPAAGVKLTYKRIFCQKCVQEGRRWNARPSKCGTTVSNNSITITDAGGYDNRISWSISIAEKEDRKDRKGGFFEKQCGACVGAPPVPSPLLPARCPQDNWRPGNSPRCPK